MDWGFFGCGLAIVILFVQSKWKVMPNWMIWPGISSGMLCIIWGIIQMVFGQQKALVGPALLFIVCFAGLVGSIVWGKNAITNATEAEHTPAETVPPPATLEQPTFREKIESIIITVGSNSVGYDINRLRDQKVMPINLRGYYPIIAYVEGNKLYADVTIYAGSGKPPIEIKHNEFVVRPLNWDKNSNQKALEVVNEKQEPVFQMIYKSETHLVINGLFPFSGGMAIADEKGMWFNPASPMKLSNRIFKYPSSKYPGQLDDAF